MTGLIGPKVRRVLGIQQGALSVCSEDKTDIPTQTINENSIPGPKAEKPQPKISEISAIENQSQGIAGSPSIPSAALIHEVKTTPTSSALVEKYEMGSGKNKINVRIFKEPAAESVTPESQKYVGIRQGDSDTLVLRLKKELAETPIQPSEPNTSKEKMELEA